MSTQQSKLATSTLEAFQQLNEDQQRQALSGMSDEVKKQLLTELQNYKPTRSTPLSVLKETFWDPYYQMGGEFTKRIGDELVSTVESNRNIREQSLKDRGINALKLGTASFRVPAGMLKDVVTGLPGALYDQGYKAAYEVGSDDPVEVAAGMIRALTLAGGLRGMYKGGKAGAASIRDAIRDPNRIRPEAMPTDGVTTQPLLVQQPKWKLTMESGFRPINREARTRLFEQLDEAVPEFIKSEVLEAGGKKINDIDGAIAVGKKAGERIYSQELGLYIDQMTDQMDLTPLADQLKSQIPTNFTESAKKSMSKKIDDTFRGKKLSGKEIENLRQMLTSADRMNAALNNIDAAAVRKLPKGWFEGAAKETVRDFLVSEVQKRYKVDISGPLRRYGSVKEVTQMLNGELPIEDGFLDNIIGRGYVSGTVPNIRGRLAEAATKTIRSNDRMIRRGFDQYREQFPYRGNRTTPFAPDPAAAQEAHQLQLRRNMWDAAQPARETGQLDLLPNEIQNPLFEPPPGMSGGMGRDIFRVQQRADQQARLAPPETLTGQQSVMLPGANEALPETPYYPGKSGVVKETVTGPDGQPVVVTRDYRRQTQLFETNPNRANPMPEGTTLAFTSKDRATGQTKYHYRTPQGMEIVTDFEVPQTRPSNAPPPAPGTSWRSGSKQPLNVPDVEGFEFQHMIKDSRGEVVGYVYRNTKTGVQLRSKKPLTKPPMR